MLLMYMVDLHELSRETLNHVAGTPIALFSWTRVAAGRSTHRRGTGDISLAEVHRPD
jgi:hypothetical protein